MLNTRNGVLAFLRMAMAPHRNYAEGEIAVLYDKYRAEFTAALQEMFGQKKTSPTTTGDGGGGS